MIRTPGAENLIRNFFPQLPPNGSKQRFAASLQFVYHIAEKRQSDTGIL